MEIPLKMNVDEISKIYIENKSKNNGNNNLNNCYLRKLEENSNTQLSEKSNTKYEKSKNSIDEGFIKNWDEANYNSMNFDKKKIHILKKKIKEIKYWENEIQNLKIKKEEDLKKKVKLHFELMNYNDGKKKLEGLEYLKKSKINGQLAVLARAEYIKEVFEKNIKSNRNVKEDNINAVILSLENLKKHIEYTYLNKEIEKKNSSFFSL